MQMYLVFTRLIASLAGQPRSPHAQPKKKQTYLTTERTTNGCTSSIHPSINASTSLPFPPFPFLSFDSISCALAASAQSDCAAYPALPPPSVPAKKKSAFYTARRRIVLDERKTKHRADYYRAQEENLGTESYRTKLSSSADFSRKYFSRRHGTFPEAPRLRPARCNILGGEKIK